MQKGSSVAPLVIRPVTAQRLSEIREDWESVAGADEFQVELGVHFDWAVEHTAAIDGDSRAHELIDLDSGETKALIEIVDGKNGALTKLLSLHLSPRYWSPPLEPNKLIELFVHAFASFFTMGRMRNGVNEIKMYGRRQELYLLLVKVQAKWDSVIKSVAEKTDAEPLEWTASMQGRWLTLRRD